MNSNYKGMRAGFATVTTLFFMWGFITVSIDPLIAALKAIFELTLRARRCSRSSRSSWRTSSCRCRPRR